MKIKKQIDNLGRIVIPKFIRESLNIKTEDYLEIEILKDKIIIKKAN